MSGEYKKLKCQNGQTRPTLREKVATATFRNASYEDAPAGPNKGATLRTMDTLRGKCPHVPALLETTMQEQGAWGNTTLRYTKDGAAKKQNARSPETLTGRFGAARNAYGGHLSDFKQVSG